jgi:trehalose 6-phosphate phosphatase
MIQLPDRAALFLDLDGTLIDIAPTPDAVAVPQDLPDVLRRVRHRLGDALAIVTGRPIAQVDSLLPGVAHAVAGEHGGAIRAAPGAPERRADVPPVPQAWLDEAETLVARFPGALLERKARGYVLHFRLAPQAGPVFEAALRATLRDAAAHRLSAAHMAWEVKPAGIDKARAVNVLMAGPPFAGRVPVFIGDDVTDEDGMRAARAFGGLGLRVQDHFGDAAGVRAWLAEISS